MCSQEIPPGHRSGFVALAGRPNVGKSTLVNRLLGQPVAAVSPRPQMTRRRQLGILTRPEAQIIFVDTPGLHHPLHKLGEYMNAEALETLRDADLILAVFDLGRSPNREDEQVAEHVRDLAGSIPALAVHNKIDLVPADRLEARRQAFLALLPDIPALAVSATRGDGMQELLPAILERLPEGPRYYSEDTITDTFERDLAADLIRAAALEHLRNEVPHCIAVRIDAYKERNSHGAYIEATLFVERESQKGIVIGKGGEMLKRIGTWARREIEALTGRKVFLQLRVKVLPGWRNDEQMLKRFGFRPGRF